MNTHTPHRSSRRTTALILAGSIASRLRAPWRRPAAAAAACGLALMLAPHEAQASLLIDPTGGTVLSFSSLDDAVSAGRSLGFTGSFFGVARTTVDVSINGNLNFASDTSFTNLALPFPTVARIAPFWDDLYLFAGSVVEKVSAGNYYSATWKGVPLISTPGSSVTAQVTWFGASQTIGGTTFQANDLVFSYGFVSGVRSPDATVGLNKGDSVGFAVLPGTTNGIITSAASLPTGAGQFVVFRPDGLGGYVTGLNVAPDISIWDGGSVNDNLGTAANWAGDIAPASGAATALIFDGATRLTPNVTAPFQASYVGFTATASAFTIDGAALTLQTVKNDSAALQTINAPIDAPAGLIMDGAGNTTLGGEISGTTLAKVGAGTLTLSGSTDNTFTGMTTVNRGTLTLNKAGGIAIAGDMTISDGTTTPGVDIVQLSGTGGNQIANTSILTFNGTTTNAGTLRMNGLSETLGGLVSAGGAGIVQNNTGGTSTLTLDVNTTDRAFAGILQNGAAGILALTKTGNATQTLSGANPYTGATNIDAGTLNLTGSLTGGTAITVNGTAVLSESSTGVISGAASITHSSTGTSTLAGANTYTGATNITAGTVVARNASAFNPTTGGAVTVGTGATLNYIASTNVPLGLRTTLAITGGAGTAIGSSLGSTFTNADINVTGAATATGTVAVNIFSVSGSQAAGTYTLVHGGAGSSLNGATYAPGAVYNNTNWTAGALSASATDLEVAISSATALTTAYWKGGFSGGANVWAISDGSGASNWAASAGGAVQAIVPGAGADVVISATSPGTAPTATVLGTNMSIKSLTIADTANGLGLAGDGFALAIGTGGVTMNPSVPASTIAANVALGSGQTWTNDSANGLTVNGAVSGTGITLGKAGTGTLTLTGSTANTYSGLTTVNAGTLLLDKSGAVQAIAAGGLTVNSGGMVQYTGTSTDMMGSGAVTLNGTGKLDFNGKTDTVGSVAIVATGAVAGTTPITNTAGGGNLTIGTLSITPTAGFTSVIDSGTGSLTLGSTVTFAAATTGQAQITGMSLLATAATTFNIGLGTGTGHDLDINSAIMLSNASGVTKSTGTGRLQFSGSTDNVLIGTTTVSAGTLILNKTGAIALGGPVTIGNGATTPGLDILQLSGTGGNQIADTSILTFIGTGADAGTFRLNALNETVGGLSSTVGAGIVENGTAGASTLTVAVNTTNRAFAGILQNGTAGTLALTKTGTASQTLSGVNTYTGATTVRAGTLRLDLSGSIGNSANIIVGDTGSTGTRLDVTTKTGGLSIGLAQTLQGIGQVDGNTTILGTHAPGNSPGLQTFNGNLAYATGSTLNWELAANVSTDTTGIRGTDFDAVNVINTGVFTIGTGVTSNLIFNAAGSTVDWSDLFWTSNHSWLAYSNANAPALASAAIFDTITVSPDSLAATLTGGTFSWSQSGNDVVLTYAVPEPGSLGLLLLGSGAMLLRRRRRTAAR